VLSEWKVPPAIPTVADTNTERILLEIPQPSEVHKGGCLSFGADGFLYAASATAAGRTMNLARRKTLRRCAGKFFVLT
jgi:glucose/arabinose dehydrogenase